MMLLENSRKTGTLRKFLPVLFASAIGWAQVTSGTIQGNIRDTTGAPVTAATVTLTEKSKGVSQKVSTDDAGAYNAQYLTPGTYRIEAEKSGFRRVASDNFVLNVDDRARLDFTLQVGELNQTVDVAAAAPLIRSESGELGEVITQHAVEDLPLNGRNFASSCTWCPALHQDSRVKICRGRAPLILVPAQTLMPWAARKGRTAGWWTALWTTNTRSTP
jgi:hypothetical protein